MLETIAAAIIAFAGTNIDDLFINMLFFAQAGSGRGSRAVVIGKYLGIGLLTLAGMLGGAFAQVLPGRVMGFLGLIPIALGVKEWLDGGNADETDGPINRRPGSLARNTALVTIANGADNIGVYISLFAGYSAAQKLICAAVFALMTALWCFLSKKLAELPGVKSFLSKYRRLLVSAVLIAIGLYVIIRSFA